MSDSLDMLTEDVDLDEIVDIDLDIDGKVMPAKNDKIALIDADTIAFTAALNSQEESEILPREFYSDDEWEELSNLNSFNELDGTYRQANVEAGVENAKAKLQRILDKTGCREVYLVFSGPNNFRYEVFPEYKANRDRSLTPEGLSEIREELLNLYPGRVTDGYEADDLVVYLKEKEPEKYILCAIDKDVLNSIEDKHFNYYESAIYNIEMKWVEVDRHTSLIWRYLQTLTGDKTDNIIGLKGIGPKKAEKILAGCFSHRDLWIAVCEAYESKGRTRDEALMNLNLVDMKLLYELEDGGVKIALRTHEELLGE